MAQAQTITGPCWIATRYDTGETRSFHTHEEAIAFTDASPLRGHSENVLDGETVVIGGAL